MEFTPYINLCLYFSASSVFEVFPAFFPEYFLFSFLSQQKSSMADDALNPETPPLKAEQATVEATVESTAHGGAESSCNHYNLETSGLASDVDGDKSLEEAEDLMEMGSKAAKENDYTEATDATADALEIMLGF